jgi:hypothetical protein
LAELEFSFFDCRSFKKGGKMKRGVFFFAACLGILSLAFSFFLMLDCCWAFSKVQKSFAIQCNESDLFIGENLGFDVVELVGCRSTNEVGAPQLPLLVTYVAIPQDLSVIGVEVIETDPVEIPGFYKVFPGQEPQIIGATPYDIVVPDPAIYNSSDPFPREIVEFVQQADLAGQNLAVLAIHPVQYRGAEERLIFNKRIEFVLHFEGSSYHLEVPNLSDHNRKKYERDLLGMVINPEDVTVPLRGEILLPFSIPPDTNDYVIISYDDYAEAAQPLADWKTKKGVQTRIVTLLDIQNWYGGSGTTEIRNFVNDAHSEWGTIYFLIVGDADKVPVEWRYFSGPGSTYGDTYLADYDDDWICEVHVGRCPADSIIQVSNFVEKVLQYEKEPIIEDYPLKVMFVALADCESFSDYVIGYLPDRFSVTRIYDTFKIDHEDSAKATINGGINFAWHYHGGWGEGLQFGEDYMTTAEVDSYLVNDNEMVNFYSLSNHSADIDADGVIAEHFTVKNPLQAGVSYVGNTGYSWITSDCYTFNGEYWAAMARSVFADERHHLGEAFSDHKNEVPPGSDNYMKYIFYNLLLCGDPEMPLWLYIPGELMVTHESEIAVLEQNFTVTVEDVFSGVEGARVCLMKGDEVYEVGFTNASGEVTLAINPTSEGTMDVTVTAYDYIPYEGTCQVVSEVTVRLLPLSPTVPRGGTLRYTVEVTNGTPEDKTFEYWSNVILWTGEPYKKNPVFGPKMVTIKAGKTRTGNLSHKVPNNAPLKTYTLCGQIGFHPDEVWDEDCFEFTVIEGSGYGHDGTDWEVIESTF